MSDSLDARLARLRAAMENDAAELDALVALAAAGEAVERAIASAEDPPRAAEEVRDAYALRIRNFGRRELFTSAELEARLETALSALGRYAGERLFARTGGLGERILGELDR